MTLASSLLAVSFIITAAIILSWAIYFLIRLFANRRENFYSNDDGIVVIAVNPQDQNAHSASNRHRATVAQASPIDSLPVFFFSSITKGAGKDRDCSICLAKFEEHDRLRLLPLCCHAFHADCVDAWLISNQNCPLCRSAIISSESDLQKRIASLPENAAPATGDSFRIDIGTVSRGISQPEINEGQITYSIGSFRYILDESVSEIVIPRLNQAESIDKNEAESRLPAPPGQTLTAEIAAQRSWLRDYVFDRLALTASSSSRAISFRSSGRYFAGSNRRSDADVSDLDFNRIGAEISEFFRWFSSM